jgi:hypothetical protein
MSNDFLPVFHHAVAVGLPQSGKSLVNRTKPERHHVRNAPPVGYPAAADFWSLVTGSCRLRNDVRTAVVSDYCRPSFRYYPGCLRILTGTSPRARKGLAPRSRFSAQMPALPDGRYRNSGNPAQGTPSSQLSNCANQLTRLKKFRIID